MISPTLSSYKRIKMVEEDKEDKTEIAKSQDTWEYECKEKNKPSAYLCEAEGGDMIVAPEYGIRTALFGRKGAGKPPT